jgi:hypothetical protein
MVCYLPLDWLRNSKPEKQIFAQCGRRGGRQLRQADATVFIAPQTSYQRWFDSGCCNADAVGEKHAGTVGSTIRAADFHKFRAGYCFRLRSTVSDSVIYTSNEAALFRWPR